MEKTPVVFISYCQKYSEVKDFFVNILEDLGFRCEVFDYGAMIPPVEAERDLINKSDAFIGILTPDYKTEDGRYFCSQTVNSEISMAYGANKPIQLFAFDNVDFASSQFSQMNTIPKIQTLAGSVDQKLSFDTKNVRQIFRVLTDFKKQIDRIFESNRDNIDAYISYHLFQIEHEIISDKELRIKNTIDAVALKNIITHTHASTLSYERPGRGIQIDENDFEFKLFAPKQCKASTRIVRNDNTSFRFHIDFEPPVVAGSEIKYAYRRKHINYGPYTYEQMQHLIDDGKIIDNIMVSHHMGRKSIFILNPTDHLKMTMKFPKGYPILKFKALVRFAKGEQIHTQETDRANELINLYYDEFDNKYSLQMQIPNPHINLSYNMYYSLPHEYDLQVVDR